MEPTNNEQPEKQQKLLEDVLHAAYHTDGASLLETDDNLDYDNLFVHMAIAVRQFVRDGGDIMQIERRWENLGANEKSNGGYSAEAKEHEELKKYYRTTALHIDKTGKQRGEI